MTFSAEQIKKNVIDQLYWDARVDASDVNVEVSGTMVTLTGTAPNYMAQQAVSEDAGIVPGVSGVNNRITVEYPTAITVPNDAELETGIQNALLWNASIDSTGINVSVTGGVATLEGSVDAFWKKIRAEEIARDVMGIIEVTNKLAVVPPDDFVDQDIANDLLSALDRNALIDVDRINVKVEHGVVTLSGVVSDSMAYRAAADTARFTTGVIDIVNNLKIG